MNIRQAKKVLRKNWARQVAVFYDTHYCDWLSRGPGLRDTTFVAAYDRWRKYAWRVATWVGVDEAGRARAYAVNMGEEIILCEG